jgi:Lrp/AsnC family transcriptional regulator, leucine-responsive regulatory protein
MDKKDSRILTELMINSRIPISRLGKKVGLSREVVNYRLEKLKKDKIILGFYAIVNTEYLGYNTHTCFFQLKGVNKEKEKEIIENLKKNDFITYLGPTIGKWNVVFDLLVKDRKQLEEKIKEIIKNISSNLENYLIINTGAEKESFPTKILGVKKYIAYSESKEGVKLDKTDLKILELLSENSRIEYKEISKKINLTGNAIKYRIKNLENNGIIQGYTISIDVRKFDYEWYNLQIKFNSINKENELKLFLKEHKNVIYFYKYLGNENWDVDIGLIAKTSSELRDFILKLREKFGDNAKINDIYIVAEELKGNHAPKGVFS